MANDKKRKRKLPKACCDKPKKKRCKRCPRR